LSATDSQLDAVQWENFFRLGSDPVCRRVKVIRQDIGDIENDVRTGLGALNTNAEGKVGAVILAMRCRIEVNNPNSPGPRFELVFTARVLEAPAMNRTEQGTGLTASVLAERTLHVLHHYLPKGLGGVQLAGKQAIEPHDDDLANGIIGWNVHVRTEGGIAAGDRVPTPSISGTAGAVVLTCPLEGALIYFTTDGGAPCSGNPEATVYGGAFVVEAGKLVRAGAEMAEAGLVPSDSAAKKF
jgi:hypothetical protein